jgi:hypothetical protein
MVSLNGLSHAQQMRRALPMIAETPGGRSVAALSRAAAARSSSRLFFNPESRKVQTGMIDGHARPVRRLWIIRPASD